MTPDERTLLTRFLQDLTQVQGASKDAEAAGLIDQTMRANPDAAYLLVQHAILSDQALYAAQQQIASLQAQLQQAQSGAAAPPSFLGGRTGGPWGAAPQQPPPQPQPRQGGSAFGNIFGSGPAPQPGGFGSFLRNAGTTAAGVAGGEFLFHGLSNLFGGPHTGFFGGGYGMPGETVTINNYGDDPGYDPGSDAGGYDDQVSYDSDNGDPMGDQYS